jgi:hypothetical protein
MATLIIDPSYSFLPLLFETLFTIHPRIDLYEIWCEKHWFFSIMRIPQSKLCVCVSVRVRVRT